MAGSLRRPERISLADAIHFSFHGPINQGPMGPHRDIGRPAQPPGSKGEFLLGEFFERYQPFFSPFPAGFPAG